MLFRSSYIRIITPCRFDSMAVGVFFAYLKSAYPQFYSKKQNTLMMFFTGLILCICFDRSWITNATYTPWIILFYSILFSFGVGLIISFIENIKINNTVVAGGIGYISKVSYSLYLYHNFIFVQPITQFTHNASSETKVIFYILFWIFVFFVSYFTYTFIEKPFLRMREKKFPEKNDIIINH